MEPTRVPKLAPYLAIHDVPGLIQFIEAGIGGRTGFVDRSPDGRIGHAELLIADGVVMLGELPPGRDPFPGMIHLYVPDAGAAFERAIRAGATPVRPVGDVDDGDRRGGVRDRWGNEWWFTQAGPARR